MRTSAFAGPVLALAVVLGAVQFASSVALRDRAQRGAWTWLVPERVAAAIDRLNPAFPIPPALRLVLARKALAAHDLAFAAQEAAKLPFTRDRLALQAGLAAARGDTAGAVRGYLEAGDLAGLEAQVAEQQARGRIPAALVLQHATIARLREDRTQPDLLAEAYFRLGRLEESQAWQLALRSAERRRHEVRAADAYALAVTLAPFDIKYLIGYGNQQLNLGDLSAAERAFGRARAVDPTSVEPLTGLGDAAYRRGDRARARDFLARARAIDAHADAVRRLAGELAS